MKEAKTKNIMRKYFLSVAIPRDVKNNKQLIVETVMVSFIKGGYNVAIDKIIPVVLGSIYLNLSLLIALKLEIIIEIPINNPKRKNKNLEPHIVIGERNIIE